MRLEAAVAKAEPKQARIAISNGLYQLDERLKQVAAQYFTAHPDQETAPYAVFLQTNPMTGHLDLIPKVGPGNIRIFRELSVAIVMEGEVGR